MSEEIKLYKTPGGLIYQNEDDAKDAEKYENFMFEYEQLQNLHGWNGPLILDCDLTKEMYLNGKLLGWLEDILVAYNDSSQGIKRTDIVQSNIEHPKPPKLGLLNRISVAIYLILSGKIPDDLIK